MAMPGKGREAMNRGRLRAQVRVDPALDDAKEGLVVPFPGGQAALGPAVSPLHGEFAVSVVVGVGALVEGHDDIRPQVLLDGDGFFGGEAVSGAVDMTLEGDPVVVDLAGLGQREDLEAARIGQQGMRPLHEGVQAAQSRHQLVAGTQVEVVGVGQHQRSAQFVQLGGGERLDRGLRAHRRKDRRFEVTMGCMEDPRAGAALAGKDFIFKHGLIISEAGGGFFLRKQRVQGQGIDPIDIIKGSFFLYDGFSLIHKTHAPILIQVDQVFRFAATTPLSWLRGIFKSSSTN